MTLRVLDARDRHYEINISAKLTRIVFTMDLDSLKIFLGFCVLAACTPLSDIRTDPRFGLVSAVVAHRFSASEKTAHLLR